ncbi:efflux RND transporter periplasmic adaptor subunit [Acetobacter musti]|nr:efflux RND transporter periplasmic adaptor subunit [Acetobacter musti]
MTRPPAVTGLTLGLIALLLSSCHKKPAKPDIRPVRSIVIQSPGSTADNDTGNTLTGQITPHRSVTVAFRVPGKIVERAVEAGSIVHAGQLLARLDDTVARQAVRAAQADADAARAALAQTTPLQKRATALMPVNAISRNEYDDVIRRYKTTQDEVQATQARLRIAREELDHTRLTADTDGVITDRLAETGEVVAAGQPVLRMATDTGRDAQFDMPADFLRDGLAPGQIMTVCLDADRTVCTDAQIYELSPDADPLTRTYRARALLRQPPPAMTLGSVVTGHLAGGASSGIRLPPSALTTQDGKPAVWIVRPDGPTVTPRQITIAGYTAGSVTIASGLKPGDRVVTAGVQALVPDQKVSLLDEADVRP